MSSLVPARCDFPKSRLLADPLEIDPQRAREIRQWPCKPGPAVERDELQTPEFFGDVMLRNRFEDNRQDPLRELNCAIHLPDAALRLHRFRRDDKYHRVGLLDQTAKARLPLLANRNVVAVEKWRKASKFEPGN
jgi:hypothetical protein